MIDIKEYLEKTNTVLITKDAYEELKRMATPLPKGHWIDWTDDRRDYCKCSVCGYGEEGEVKYGEESNFCPNCGADMRESEVEG